MTALLRLTVQLLTFHAAGDHGNWLTAVSETSGGLLFHLELTGPGASAGGGARGERSLPHGPLRQ